MKRDGEMARTPGGETARRRGVWARWRGIAREAAERFWPGVILRDLQVPKDLRPALRPSLLVAGAAGREEGSRHFRPEILRGLTPPQDDNAPGSSRCFADCSAHLNVAASPSGSTLIELIVVLVIVAILFGVTIPALTAVPAGASGHQGTDSLRLAAVRSGQVVRGDSLTALPDGRTLTGGGPDAR